MAFLALAIGIETAFAGHAVPQQAVLTVSIAGAGTGSVISNPAGITCGTICSSQFAVGTTVFLSAQPFPDTNGGYSTFGGYSDNCTRAVPPGWHGDPSKLPRLLPWCKVTLGADTTVQATFRYFPPCVVPSVKGMTLHFAKRQLRSANCSAGVILHTFSRRVNKGRVTNQIPQAGSQENHGAPVILYVSKGRRHSKRRQLAAADAASSVASAADQATLTVSVAGNGMGVVTSNPTGISCGTICSAQFPVGTTVRLNAVAAVGSTGVVGSATCQHVMLPGWKLAPVLSVCEVTLTGDTTVQSTFDPLPPCVVPNVRGFIVYMAKHRLWELGRCTAGTIRHVFSRKVEKGVVISQNPRPGWQRENGAKVNLVVSKGRR